MKSTINPIIVFLLASRPALTAPAGNYLIDEIKEVSTNPPNISPDTDEVKMPSTNPPNLSAGTDIWQPDSFVPQDTSYTQMHFIGAASGAAYDRQIPNIGIMTNTDSTLVVSEVHTNRGACRFYGTDNNLLIWTTGATEAAVTPPSVVEYIICEPLKWDENNKYD